jgi:hypothetical protein
MQKCGTASLGNGDLRGKSVGRLFGAKFKPSGGYVCTRGLLRSRFCQGDLQRPGQIPSEIGGVDLSSWKSKWMPQCFHVPSTIQTGLAARDGLFEPREKTKNLASGLFAVCVFATP